MRNCTTLMLVYVKGGIMKEFIEKVDGVLMAIRKSELRNNQKASAKAFEIRAMIEEIKTADSTIQGAL